jgi:hypothetical protein
MQMQLQPSPLAAVSSPEVQLLFACARMQLDEEHHERIQILLQQTINWNLFLQMGAHHGILPLLNRSLKQIYSKHLPVAVMTRLQEYCRVNAMRNLGLTQELLRLLSVFEQHGIQVIPYKGPTLAVMAYGDLLMRQFCDLDFLIARQSWDRVQELLRAESYTLRDKPTASEAEQTCYFQSSCEYTYLNADQTIAIEPHWNILPKRFCIPLDFYTLGKLGHTVSLLGQSVTTFTPEVTLLIVCLNGTKDRWQKLKLICDVAELVYQHPSLNWEQLWHITKCSGCQRILLLGLYLAKTLFEAPLPTSIWEAVAADAVVHPLATQVLETISSPNISKQKMSSNFSIWDIRIRERSRDKLWYCWNLFTSPNEGDASIIKLPSQLYWFYSFIRPLRLIYRVFYRLVSRTGHSYKKSS